MALRVLELGLSPGANLSAGLLYSVSSGPDYNLAYSTRMWSVELLWIDHERTFRNYSVVFLEEVNVKLMKYLHHSSTSQLHAKSRHQLVSLFIRLALVFEVVGNASRRVIVVTSPENQPMFSPKFEAAPNTILVWA